MCLLSPSHILATTFTAAGVRAIGGSGPWRSCWIESGRIQESREFTHVFLDDALGSPFEHVMDSVLELANAGRQATCNVVFRDSGHGFRGGG